MTGDEFVKMVNGLRLKDPQKWHFWQGEVDGRQVRLKVFNTYIQIFEVDGVRHGGLMDQKVGEYKKTLAQPFQEKPGK